ncbi:MAG TPA: RecX family transcriptional regulator [Acetobacteraceae bacterium]|nr:RecX family transcriptional regulator [Acetobacteraceae bacterium]
MSRGKSPRSADEVQAALHEAALAHLARYAATSAGLERVLLRRLARWAREPDAIQSEPAAARAAAKSVVARLVAAGAVDDAAFAAARARRLARTGNSRLRIAAHLARHGITGTTLAAALPSDRTAELLAALTLARRRHIGPFRAAPRPDPDTARRELAILARAGFPAPVAKQALAMPRADAEERLAASRRAGAEPLV